MAKQDVSRREFVRKAAYVAPAILTLAAAASYAKEASKPIIRPTPRPIASTASVTVDTTTIT
jgi:hypothetical protein